MTARLGVLVVLLAVGAAAGFGLLALREGERAAALAAAQAEAEHAESVYAVAAAAARERDLVHLAPTLTPEEAATLRPHIAGARAAGELPAGLRAAVAAAADTGPLDRATEDVIALRPRVDAAAAAIRDAATEAVARTWLAAATMRTRQLLQLAGAIAGGPGDADESAAALHRARHAAAMLAERFGYERGLLARAASAGQALPQELAAELALAAGGMEFAWQELAAAGLVDRLSVSAADALARAREQFDGGFAPLRQAMIAGALGGGGMPAAALWLDRSEPVLTALERVGPALGRAMAERIASIRGDGRGDAAIHAVLALTALLLGLLALLTRARPQPAAAPALPAPVATDRHAMELAAAADAALDALTAAIQAADAALAVARDRIGGVGTAADPRPVSSSALAAERAALRGLAEQARLLGLNAALDATRLAEARAAVPTLAAGAQGLAERIAASVDDLDRMLADMERAMAATPGTGGRHADAEAVAAAEDGIREAIEALARVRDAAAGARGSLHALHRHIGAED